MDVVTAARAQMEVSLAFHIIFAALGIGMPLLMLMAEGWWLRTGQPHYRALARKWGKATALTFAVGAVSGTALSFELGLLWPRFMALAGGVVGSAFALEGYAFFIEAIFLGLYLYGWDRLSPRAHWLTGIPVAVSGFLSGILVVAANAWMQSPVGFQSAGGVLTAVDPWAPFRSPAWLQMSIHSSLACYISTGFAVAGVYAVGTLRGRRDAYHRSGIALPLALAGVAALLQPLSGDISARQVAASQPAKLAAMEALFHTRPGAPLLIGGIPDVSQEVVHGAIEVPGFLSFLVAHDFHATVPGLDALPRTDWPNVLVMHFAFQLMVGCAFLLIFLAAWYAWGRWRGRAETRWLLRALAVGAPFGFLALEAGWIVTEVGRQPWVIHGVMRTVQGATPASGVRFTFLGFSVLYLALGAALVLLLRRLATGDQGLGREEVSLVS